MDYKIGKLSVSRETFERLELYADLLKKWNPKINIVSKTSLDDLWGRHIVDSAQMFSLLPSSARLWVDMGSGGGFPGLVVAVLARELAPELRVTLIESDQRKCAFLRTVSRETEGGAKVLTGRIEEIEPLNADVVSARALADLSKLLEFGAYHRAEAGICLFPKGLTWEKEVQAARDSWRFSLEVITSETQENAVILKINEIDNA